MYHQKKIKMGFKRDYRISMLSKLDNEIEDDSFINESKFGNERSFSRNRFFNLRKIIVVIMLLRTSYQRELNAFCKRLIGGDYNIREVTAGALSQARAKLNPWAFQRLNEVAINSFYEDAEYTKWKNFRLLAVDGSVLNLPFSQNIIEQFGSEDYVIKHGAKKSLARCSIVYDVLNHTTIDAQLGPYKESEKSLLERSLAKLKTDDLLLGDRGYSYSSIMYWLSERNIDFCLRIKEDGHNAWNVVKQFTHSSKKEDIVELKFDTKIIKSLGVNKDYRLKVRLIKIQLDEKTEVLCTSLFDKRKYPHKDFKNLYHQRWGVEEAYKMLKSRIRLEMFSGKTAQSIYQDFHAKILMMTLCATLSHPIAKKVKEEFSKDKRNNKYDQGINRADALSETRSNIFQIFINKVYQLTIDIMDELIIASRQVIRPFRSNKRLKTVRPRPPLSYKNL